MEGGSKSSYSIKLRSWPIDICSVQLIILQLYINNNFLSNHFLKLKKKNQRTDQILVGENLDIIWRGIRTTPEKNFYHRVVNLHISVCL